jgi:hypothetical protein
MDSYAWGNTIRLWAEIKNPDTGELETPAGVIAQVRRPTGELETPTVVVVSDGLVRADYDPLEPGVHEWWIGDPAGIGGDPGGAADGAFHIRDEV